MYKIISQLNALKAEIATKASDPTFIGTTRLQGPVVFSGGVSGLVKSDVGLGNVDNTSDASKPVSSATQTALDLKANLASPTFTGTVNGIAKAMVGLGSVDNTRDVSKPVSSTTQTALNAKAPVASPTFTWTAGGIAKAMVDFGNVDITGDTNFFSWSKQ